MPGLGEFCDYCVLVINTVANPIFINLNTPRYTILLTQIKELKGYSVTLLNNSMEWEIKAKFKNIDP